MSIDDVIWTLQDLSHETGLGGRVIRSWIERGLLPGASGRGKGARYSQLHLDRLKCIQSIREAAPSLGLDELRQVLLSLSDDRIRAIATGEEPVIAMPVASFSASSHDEGEAAGGNQPESYDDGAEASLAISSRSSASGSALDYIRRLRQQDRGAAVPSTRFSWGDGGGRPGSRLDRLFDSLRSSSRLRHVKPTSRAEMWASIPITPDIEIRARGLDDHDLQRLERVADYLRELLMRDVESTPHPDPRGSKAKASRRRSKPERKSKKGE